MRRSDDWITDLHYQKKKKDFYWENGEVIMTEQYHLERGSCCGSGCKHCPFWPPYQKMNSQLRDDIESYRDKE